VPGRGQSCAAAALIGAMLCGAAPAAADSQPVPSPALTVALSASQIDSGGHVTVSGTVTGVPPGTTVRLFTSPYPFPIPDRFTTTTTAADGSYSFTVSPDRDTRYRVDVPGTAASARTPIVEVIDRTITTVSALPLGRAKVSILVFHPLGIHWAEARVSWWFSSGRARFTMAPATKSRELSRYVVELSTTVALSAGRFRWRACLYASGAAALANPRRPPGCTGRGYYGFGSLPYGFPGPAAIARAEAYLNSRGGHTALAVVDSEGRMSGIRTHDQFITGSAVKAMLLVAYLRRLNAMGQHTVDPNSNSFLYPMINQSDNNAATQCWSIVGNGGLYALAHAAGMTDFSVDTNASWGSEWGAALLSAADQAKFFFEMDSLIPKEFVGYARYLLSTIAGYESWGIPAVARPLGYRVFFKAGWRPSPDTFLVHQIARLEGHHRTFSMAVMTDGDPDMGYGIDTIQGVTARLLD
jgi:hypothetical protein